MKVYICIHEGYDHADIMKVYTSETSAKIWLNQINERIEKNQEIPEEEFGEWYNDGFELKGSFGYEEYEAI